MPLVTGPLAMAIAVALAAAQARAALPLARPPVPSAAIGDWREAPLTAGAWSLRQGPGGSSASFGHGSAARLVVRCDPKRRVLRIAVPAAAAPAQLATLAVRTSSQNRSLAATGGKPWAEADVEARDPLLDAIVFSRGRWAVWLEAGRLEAGRLDAGRLDAGRTRAGGPDGQGRAPGSEMLVLPASAEVARIVEDCRN